MPVIPVGALIRNREVPEIGPGRVIAAEGSSAKVVFQNSEEIQQVRLEHTDIVRLPLIPGTLVRVRQGDSTAVGEVIEADWPDQPSQLCVYEVDLDGSLETVFESHLDPLTPDTTDPLEQLGCLHWRGPFRFFSRWEMHRMVAQWYADSEGLPALLGARVRPTVPPVFATRALLWSEEPRALVAVDGAGARREAAGMAIEQMLSEDEDRRILVLAPGARSRGWQTELEWRFGDRRFVRVDQTHLSRAPESRWSELLQHRRLVVSMSCLARWGDACASFIADGDWDVVVVDEAHRLQPTDRAFGCLEALAVRETPMVLLADPDAHVDQERWAALESLVVRPSDPEQTGRTIALPGDYEPQQPPLCERRVERLSYEADDGEAAIAAHLSGLAAGDSAAQQALHVLYHQAITRSPDALFDLLHRRLEALETGVEPPDFDPLALWALDPDPAEEHLLTQAVIAGAPPVDAEDAWLAQALSLVGQWHGETAEGSARFRAAAGAIEAHLDADPRHRVAVFAGDVDTTENVAIELRLRLGDDAVVVVHSELDRRRLDEALERFVHDEACRVLVCDESDAQGRATGPVSALVHLNTPPTLSRVGRRLTQYERPRRENRVDEEGEPIEPLEQVSIHVCGPSAAEAAVAGLAEALAAGQLSLGVAPDADLRLLAALAAGGESVEALARQLHDELSPPQGRPPVDADFLHSVEEAEEFVDLLDFIDGVENPLPVRHWARMLGINDESRSPGIYDFKWHWAHVRRPLPGYDAPATDELDLLNLEERVGRTSGTFSRKRALRRNDLAFFAPGQRFIDALTTDALAPTDGRATVFARRLGPENRGKAFLLLTLRSSLDAEAFGDEPMPAGLVRRAHRRLWPESVSVAIEVDLRGRRAPKVVEDWDLLQKIEASYQGPEADKKLEYEMLAQAIQNAADFRGMLEQATKLGLAHVRAERQALVEEGAEELAADLAAQKAHLESVADGDGEAAQAAAARLARYECLFESMRQETLSLDAIAVIVAGTPQVLR